MRGAPGDATVARQSPRIIPADAGSTPPKLLLTARMEGSSPRMRGALYGFHPPSAQPRIIPADAGSTEWQAWVLDKDEDHPRGCGEHNPDTAGP